jgi:hypothetical protein
MAVVSPQPLPPPVDRVFDNGVVGAGTTPNIDAASDDPYDAIVRELIDDAQSFEEGTLAPDREENLEYFYGEQPAPEGEGTSEAVSTDVRDTVMAILPSLIRVFTAEEQVLTVHPNYEGQEEMAKQCLDYLNYVFWNDNPGFLILHDVIKDALRCKIGVMKWWTDTSVEVQEQKFRNITTDQAALLMEEAEGAEMVSYEPAPGFPDMLSEFVLRFKKSKPITHVEAVPLDEFRIDRKAKTVQGAMLIGQDQITQIGELVRMGFVYDELVEFLGATSTYSVDRQYRNEGLDESNVMGDLDVRYGYYFIRIDKDGDGIPELREIHTIGDNHVIIKDEPVQYANFAVWCPDPEPHTVVGDTPAELVKDIQKIKTNMLRGSLDSLAQSIWPRVAFNEMLVDVDDVMNDEIGAAIRTRGNPMETIQSFAHQFVGQPVFQMFEVMEVLRQQRTGINDASKGLDPKALQSTALQGVDAIITGAQERIELCARILAETGMVQLFKGLLRECVNSPNQERTIQLRGKWTQVDPSVYDPDMRVSVNPKLGKGSDMTRLMALQDVRSTQTMVMEKFGVENPLCGVQEFRNTLVDMLSIANIKNPERYFRVVSDETIAQIAAAPKEPDPATLLAQAELEKTKAKMASELAKDARETQKLMMDDDFRRDELRVTSILDAAKIEGQWEYDVNEQQLSAVNTALTAAEMANDNEEEAMDAAQ